MIVFSGFYLCALSVLCVHFFHLCQTETRSFLTARERHHGLRRHARPSGPARMLEPRFRGQRRCAPKSQSFQPTGKFINLRRRQLLDGRLDFRDRAHGEILAGPDYTDKNVTLFGIDAERRSLRQSNRAMLPRRKPRGSSAAISTLRSRPAGNHEGAAARK